MKKKIFFSILILILSLTFFRCNIEPPPCVESVSYAGGIITISLTANNRITDMDVIKSKITLTKDSFNGTEIDFTIDGTTAEPCDTYEMTGFSPLLLSGHDYYMTFEEGAFGNYGIWEATGTTGESLPGSYVITVP